MKLSGRLIGPLSLFALHLGVASSCHKSPHSAEPGPAATEANPGASPLHLAWPSGLSGTLLSMKAEVQAEHAPTLRRSIDRCAFDFTRDHDTGHMAFSTCESLQTWVGGVIPRSGFEIDHEGRLLPPPTGASNEAVADHVLAQVLLTALVDPRIGPDMKGMEVGTSSRGEWLEWTVIQELSCSREGPRRCMELEGRLAETSPEFLERASVLIPKLQRDARLAGADLTAKVVLEPDTLVPHRFLWDLTLSLARDGVTEPMVVRVPLFGLFMYQPDQADLMRNEFFDWLPPELDPRPLLPERERSYELTRRALRARSEGSDAAAKIFQEAMSVDPTFPDPALYLGELRRDQYDFTGAEDAYRKAVARAETDGNLKTLRKARRGLASLLGELAQESREEGQASGRCREALQIADRLLADNPDDFRALKEKGHCLALMGEAGPAIEVLRQAIDLQPVYVSAYAELAQIHGSSGDHAKAREVANEAIRTTRDSASSWCLLGDVHRRANELAQARKAYQRALERSPRNLLAHSQSDALWGLAQVALASKRTKEARKWLEQLVESEERLHASDSPRSIEAKRLLRTRSGSGR